MIDLLWRNKEWLFSGIGVAVIATVVAIVRKLAARPPDDSAAQRDVRTFLMRRRRPLKLEVLPQYFELRLDDDVPEIRVYLFAVNYLKAKVKLVELRVDQFRLSVGTVLDGIALVKELNLDGQRAHYVTCRRALIDSEVRTFLKGAPDARPNASITINARAMSGRKTIEYEHAGIAVNGYISRPVGGENQAPAATLTVKPVSK